MKTARATTEAFVKNALTAGIRQEKRMAGEGEQQREIAVKARDPRTSQAACEAHTENGIA